MSDTRAKGVRRRPASREAVRDAVDRLVERRKNVRLWWEKKAGLPPNGPVIGLALSGGGIRSATFSLGLIQALAKTRDALSKIDIVSSVSGGGYIACFLRSLFLPDKARGISPDLPPEAVEKGEVELDREELKNQHGFAMAALKSGPDVHKLGWETTGGAVVQRRNPLWWLREHSRYLAPNGPTDYGYAVAYLTRNWVAMLYTFLLASLGIFTSLILVEAVASIFVPLSDLGWVPFGSTPTRQLPCGLCEGGTELVIPVSPVVWLAALPLLMTVGHSIAYWMTQAMSPNEPDVARQRRNLFVAAAGTIVATIAISILSWALMPGAVPPKTSAFSFDPGAALFVRLLWLVLFAMLLGAFIAFAFWLWLGSKGPGLTSELRRQITQWITNWNFVLLIVLALAIVDSLGAALETWFRSRSSMGTSIAALLPILAYLIKKLPDWFGGTGTEKGKIAALFSRFLSTIALFAGIILFGMLAVAADALAHGVAWGGMAWNDPQWSRLLLFIGIVWVLGVLSGWSSGFINLSSLHSLYSARLTRAYLGASNNNRLEAVVEQDSCDNSQPDASAKRGPNIRESDPKDYVQPPVYCRADLPAPLHIINATLNETIDPDSQLVSRDRKGDILSLEPDGIRIGRELAEWERIGGKEAEQLSLGQWCSISGAAASSGMGRLTNLGFALVFTFANVRLGYWWYSPKVCRVREAAGHKMRRFTKWFGTFVYLFNEMTARYSRGYQRKYITDGGHFENSGAYRLIGRRVPLILVTDNGADPKYRFEDLENLVRKVRLDLGGEIELLSSRERDESLRAIRSRDPSIFAQPERWTDWRDEFLAKDSGAYVLLLKAVFEDETLQIVWLKPRTQPGMPADLMGYSAVNPLFPQQPTGDQFFDEAQWESYRRLGEISMARLLDTCPELLAGRRWWN